MTAMTCEKCWDDAYLRSLASGRTQADEYRDVLAERIGRPCTAEQRAGQFWDAEHKRDSRLMVEERETL